MCTRLAASVRQTRHDPVELHPTESCAWCSLFLLSFGCDSSGHRCVAHGTGLIPNETRCPCRTLVACLVSRVLVSMAASSCVHQALAWTSSVTGPRQCGALPNPFCLTFVGLKVVVPKGL